MSYLFYDVYSIDILKIDGIILFTVQGHHFMRPEAGGESFIASK
jgi:hypothetical protein